MLSQTALLELQAAFNYLMDGFEDMAVESLSCTLSGYAEKMTGAVNMMQKKFEQEEENCAQTSKVLMEKQISIEKQDSSCNSNIECTELLHYAISALKGLAAVMNKATAVMNTATIFWMQLSEHCQNWMDGGIKERVERVYEHSEEKRLRIWTSNAFKKQAITYFAKWVALYSVCGECVGHIKHAQEELNTHITESPTQEQCKKRVHKLCEDFMEL